MQLLELRLGVRGETCGDATSDAALTQSREQRDDRRDIEEEAQATEGPDDEDV